MRYRSAASENRYEPLASDPASTSAGSLAVSGPWRKKDDADVLRWVRGKETLLIMIHHITAGVVASSLLMSSAALAQTPPAGQPPAQSSPAPQAAPLNLNTATKADLEKLPGVGARVAARIVEYREKKGPFKKVEELMNVQGIGEKNFLKLKSQLTVGPSGQQ